MQTTLTTTFTSGSTRSQAYGWPSNPAQDLDHRYTTTGWGATAVWGTLAIIPVVPFAWDMASLAALDSRSRRSNAPEQLAHRCSVRI
jgi:hypothetical protein